MSYVKNRVVAFKDALTSTDIKVQGKVMVGSAVTGVASYVGYKLCTQYNQQLGAKICLLFSLAAYAAAGVTLVRHRKNRIKMEQDLRIKVQKDLNSNIMDIYVCLQAYQHIKETIARQKKQENAHFQKMTLHARLSRRGVSHRRNYSGHKTYYSFSL